MKQFTINFAGVKTYYNFYEAIIKGLQLPDWCGDNPDAIWDMLTGYMEFPATIRMQGTALVPKDLMGEMDLLMNIFQRVEDIYDEIKYTLKIIS